MSAAVSNSRCNRLEGIVLIGLLQGLPTFSGAALLLKLVGSSAIGSFAGGPAIFVIATSIAYAISVAYLAPKFPAFFRASHEPVFFDASLSIREKVGAWLAQPKTALQLLTSVMMLSVLGVVVAGWM